MMKRENTMMKRENTMMQFRQGDVFIEQIDAPPDDLTPIADDRGRVVLAYGEVTGHAHALHARSAAGALEVALFQSGDGRRFLHVQAPTARLYHEEHEEIILPGGWHEITIQREYSPEAIRNVVD